MSSSRRPRPFRVGDLVRVTRSRVIRRVGYPLVWYELLEEVEKDPRTIKTWEYLHTGKLSPCPALTSGQGLLTTACPTKIPRYFLKAVAMAKVEERGFGGQVRQIFYEQDKLLAPDITGRMYRVTGRRHVKTGVRVAASSGVTYTYDGPDYWEEPGGLADLKVHTLLMLDHTYEVEACDVELVESRT